MRRPISVDDDRNVKLKSGQGDDEADAGGEEECARIAEEGALDEDARPRIRRASWAIHGSMMRVRAELGSRSVRVSARGEPGDRNDAGPGASESRRGVPPKRHRIAHRHGHCAGQGKEAELHERRSSTGPDGRERDHQKASGR